MTGSRLFPSRGFTPFAIVLVAAMMWAFVPLLLAGPAYDASSGSAATLLVNLAKAATAIAVAIPLFWTNFGQVAAAVRTVALSLRLSTLLAVDGVLIAASNLLFILALGQGFTPGVVLILNSWPIVTSLMSARHSAAHRRLSLSQLAGSGLAVFGLLIVILASENGRASMLSDPTSITLAIAGAIGQGVVVQVHQRFLRSYGDSGWRLQPLWQGLRAIIASAATLVFYIFSSPSAVQGGPTSFDGLTGAMLLAGALWAASGMAFHLAVARSENSFASAPWLITPLLSAVLVGISVDDTLPRSVVLGGVIVLAANSILNLTIEPPRNVSLLVATLIGTALLVATIRGRDILDFYSIGQTLGTFFAISFGFLAARLHEQRTLAKVMEIRASLGVSSDSLGLFSRNHVPNNRQSAEARADREAAAHLRRGLLPISEAMVVTALGAGSCFVLVYGRPSNPIGDIVVFAIVSTVIFSTMALWGNILDDIRRAEQTVLDKLAPGQLGEAVFGYLSTLVAYLGILVAFLLADTDWPTF